MHDIGKVNTPLEILNKPDKLDKQEFDIMKQHVVDGAHILRRTPEMPALAPIVAFEHHLKQDLSGYPENIGSRKLNLCTMIVTIADVFDALRSNRPYRQGLATDRIRRIMDEQDNPAFNQPLLKRFVNMMGLFPVGNLVRLTHRRARGRDRRTPVRSVPASGEDHHQRQGRDARRAGPRQHLGTGWARRTSPRGGRGGGPRVGQHRSVELHVGHARTFKRRPLALSPEDATRLIEFARACKAAARAVTLYPMGHPAIVATLGRIVEMTSSARMAAPLRITVLPDGLLLDERPPARADAAIAELAELLHSHVIGALTVNAGGDVEAWRNFLLLLGRAPDAVRAEGGIARVWATTAGQHLELREIDYAQVLREAIGRQGGRLGHGHRQLPSG